MRNPNPTTLKAEPDSDVGFLNVAEPDTLFFLWHDGTQSHVPSCQKESVLFPVPGSYDVGLHGVVGRIRRGAHSHGPFEPDSGA